jgi:hypothetical protein
MSATIISFAEARAARSASGTREVVAAAVSATADSTARFYFWTGASGRRYVHTIYSIFDCPPLDAGNYILAKRDGSAQRRILAIGRVAADGEDASALRQRAAEIGADEVHIHLLATSAAEAHAIEYDLAQWAVGTTG